MFFLVSCGSGVRYSDELPLSTLIFRAGAGRLSGLVPEGWTTAPRDAADESSGTLVLVRGDSLRIVVRSLLLESTAAAYYSGRGPADLASLNRTLRDTSSAGRMGGISTFSIRDRNFAAYELHAPAARSRVVVFNSGEAWFECEAMADRTLSGETSYDDLFSAQQTLLASLR
jgi:hypothetical protein